MSLKIRRLSHALGAHIIGIDLRGPLNDTDFREIHSAFLEHCVLLFREQPLTREQHIAFSRRFGELDKNEEKAKERPAGYPEITLVISKPMQNGAPATGRYTGAEWHTDHSNYPIAAMASLLRSVEVPEIGGDTMFANMYRAYESLSDGMKKLLEGLYGVHMQGRAHIDNSSPERAAESRRRFPAAAHPIVRVHPETGRKALYINEQVRLFVGMTAEESKPLIQHLTNHAVRPQNVYRHQWQKDDLLMWDNRCLLHIALADYDRTKVRHMERTTVNGTPSGYAYDGPLE
jgi:taurine dioxygenase